MITEIVEIVAHIPKFGQFTADYLQLPMHVMFHMVQTHYDVLTVGPEFDEKDLDAFECVFFSYFTITKKEGSR